jgi:hypothetical protein
MDTPDSTDGSDHPGDPTPAPPSYPPSSLRYRILVAVGLLVAAGALYAAIHLTNTDDAGPVTVTGQPNVVQQLIPGNGSSELRQSELGIDLAPGYDAALIVNGVEIPRRELRVVAAQNQVFFTPGAGKVIEELDGGRTCVVAVVWKSSQGRGTPQDTSVAWCFTVT